MTNPGSQLDISRIIQAIKSVLPESAAAIALHEPTFEGREWDYVKECLDSGWVSTAGTYVDQFEEELASFTRIRRAVAVVNGTAALHTCLLLLGVRPNDEVLVPTLTFVATANAVTYCGAIPHFVDSEIATLGMDPEKLADYLSQVAQVTEEGSINKLTRRRIKAVIPVHTFGHPVSLEPLLSVCRQFNLELIEDAAESLGSQYKGAHTGSWGKLAALSFNGNKTITTGGGGAILTQDEQLGRLAKHLTTTARVPHRWEVWHDMIGFNYRMPNLNAALGCAQMEILPNLLDRKRALARAYQDAFDGIEGVSFFTEPPECRSNYWLNTLILDEACSAHRDEVLDATHQAGLLTRPCWQLMHLLPMYRDCPHMDLSMAESLVRRIISLPSSPKLGTKFV